MTMRHLTILATVCLCVQVSLSQSIAVIAANHADSVVLRWAPTTPEAFGTQHHTGYRVERITISGNAAGATERLGPDSIKPWPLERFKRSFPKDHAQAPAAVQVLYGKVAPEQRSGLEPVNAEMDIRWSIGLFAADMDAGIAEAMGLRFVDTHPAPNAYYYYRVIALIPGGDTAVVAMNRKLGNYSIPEGPAISAEEGERRVDLQWETEATQGFSAYHIERRTNNSGWHRLNTRPFVPMHPEGRTQAALHSWSDTTMVGNYVPAEYRVLGVDPFGNTSLNAPVISAMGRDRTPPPAPVMKRIVDEGGRMVVYWEQPAGAKDLSGYRVEKAVAGKEGFYSLHNGLLPPATTHFTDTSSVLMYGNYYRVAVLDTAGNIAYSLGGYGSLVDSIAPAVPKGLSGSIDTNGVVTVRWDQGREPDILGYRVFFANQPDHEFNNLTPTPQPYLVFSDTIPLRTLTKHIHYKVVAVDRNFNHSGYSAMLTLTKPDLVEPASPLFKHYTATDSSVVLELIPSSSDDVAEHLILRKDDQTAGYREVARFMAGKMQRTWVDQDLAGPHTYHYQLIAVDSAGNRSLETQAIEVTVHGKRRNQAPTDMRATLNTDHTVRVMWKAPASGVKHYIVHRTEEGGAPIAVASPRSGETEFVDRRIPRAGSYTYSVRAVYSDGSMSTESKSATISITQ